MLNTDTTSALLQAQELFAFPPDGAMQELRDRSCERHVPGLCCRPLPGPGTPDPSQLQEVQWSARRTVCGTSLTLSTSS